MTSVHDASSGTPLDNPVWHALTGPHAHFAWLNGDTRRYRPDVAPFCAVADPASDDLAGLPGLVSPGGTGAIVATVPVMAPSGLRIAMAAEVLQMACESFRPHDVAHDLVPLTDADVPDMLALVELTHPGPFAARTIEMGRYLGLKREGKLVAMTGERMRLAGFTEVSAVCVHPDARGQGLAKVLVSAVTQNIVARGETPFLHVYPDNVPAIATYEAIGFTARRQLHFTVFEKAE